MKQLIQYAFRNTSLHSILVPAALVAMLGGCATATTHEGMVATTVEVAKKHPQSVSVAVTGGKETESTGAPQISDPTFKKALEESIVKSQTFSRVVEGSGGDYILTVVLFGLDQPSFGLTFTVKMEAGWTLKRAGTGATVWQESIKSEHSATTSDAFAAVTRLRLATEGAAKNNIAQGLARISKLNL